MMKMRLWVSAGFVVALVGAAANAASETEFATSAELRATLPETARHTLDTRSAREEPKAATLQGSARDVRKTNAALQSDSEMVATRQKYSGAGPSENAEPAVAVTDVTGSALSNCSVLAQEVQGSLYEGKYSGWTRVFKCEGRPLIVLNDRALKHGNERTLVSQERVNDHLVIRGVKRGVVLSRLHSSTTGNGLTTVLWRDGDKIVSLRVNDYSDETYEWVRTVAQSIK